MKCDVSITNRLKRAKGQLQGVLNMMDGQTASCEDLVTQLKAIKTSLEKAIGILTTQNLIDTIESKHEVKLSDLDSALDLIIKNM